MIKTLLTKLMQNFHSSEPFAYTAQGEWLSFAQFWQDVADRAVYLTAQSVSKYALWCHDSYQFFVWLWACVLAQKTVILPPHLQAQMIEDFKQQNIVLLDSSLILNTSSQTIDDFSVVLESCCQRQSIIFYTSGSTGQPKHIHRTMQQLLMEAQQVIEHFKFPEHFVMVSSVSHQHLYGLTFQLFVPFYAGQVFYHQQFIYPEHIDQYLTDYQKKYPAYREQILISSPALLKRCQGVFDFADAKRILSSGGRLESGIRAFYPQGIMEVYGSSETGAIAYRQGDGELWQALSDVQLKISDEQTLCVKMVRAFQSDWIDTRDCVQMNGQQFVLLGRQDRIVKLEEKRLSLDEIELKVNQLDEVLESYALLVEHENRAFLSIAVVLHEQARQVLQEKGKRLFLAQLKQKLQHHLAPIAMPKHWRFITELVRNTQSKINRAWVSSLFLQQDYPHILSQQFYDEQLSLRVEISPELNCFKGHFEGFPIYAGVGQLAFLIYFARQQWLDLAECCACEQIKFQDLIRPYDVIDIHLKREQHKIIFTMHKAEKVVASGRLLFNLKAT